VNHTQIVAACNDSFLKCCAQN